MLMILQKHAYFFFNKNTKESLINIGSGVEKTITEFAKFIMKKTKIKIKIKYDKNKPNGTPRKILDSTLALKYGWKAETNLDSGLELVAKSLKIKNI